MNNKIVIIGATSAIAEYCAREWVSESPQNLVLLGRDRSKVARVAKDLCVRSPKSNISVQTIDFSDSLAIQAWVKKVCEMESPDIVLIAHGTLPDQVACQQDLAMNSKVLEVNGISPVLFAEGFAGYMEKANRGKLVIISSVAGDRGRMSNYVYGAAKGLVTRYAQGLQHRLSRTKVKVVLIKPGPTLTPMTAHLLSGGSKMSDLDQVSKCIIRGVKRSLPVVYAPAKWRVIMMIIRHLPNLIFNRMNI